MPVKITYKKSRSGADRRTGFTVYDGAERRSGEDRRKLEEKLKNMIQKNIEEQKKEPLPPPQQRSGGVIRRKKSEKGKPTKP